jgi:hypothetical protein
MPKIVDTHAVREIETRLKGWIDGSRSSRTDRSTLATAPTCRPSGAVPPPGSPYSR